jgi:hypothetical protein
MPRPEKITKPPQIFLPTGRPVLRWLLPRPPMMKQRAWGSFESLFSSGFTRVSAFEEKVRELANHLGQRERNGSSVAGMPRGEDGRGGRVTDSYIPQLNQHESHRSV